MTSATDFLVVCCGVSILICAIASAIRLLGFKGRPEKQELPSFMVRPELPPPEPASTVDLVDKLKRFQDTRFAPPIIKQQLERGEYVPKQGEPGGRRVVPQKLLRPRSFSTPRQPPKKPVPLQREADVIPFPLRQREDSTTKKD
jgi:hypothetical protein